MTRIGSAEIIRPRLRQAGHQSEAITDLALQRGRNGGYIILLNFLTDPVFFNAVKVFDGRTCHGGISPGQLRLVDFLHIGKGRGDDDRAKQEDREKN